MNSLSDFSFMGWIKILFILYSYNTDIYLFTLFEVIGNLPVKSVAIRLLWLMILVKNVLVCCTSSVIVGSSCLIGSFSLVDLMFSLFDECVPWLLLVIGGRFLLIRSISKFVHVVKQPFLMDWLIFCLTGLNSVV